MALPPRPRGASQILTSHLFVSGCRSPHRIDFEIAHWKQHTVAAFEAVTLPGDRLFLHGELVAVADLVERELEG
ncbi:MAG: hypothetical protein QOH12_3525 [Solirubrobacteraceae bacterium]|nr:hypothetical protein [Solirubrobacteraceae bacterium]